MSALVCSICGGKLVMSGDGAVCESCGIGYSINKLQEMLRGSNNVVRVDNSEMIGNYLELIKTAMDTGNMDEAEHYANKIIEIDPGHAKAWFYKGAAAGWQTSLSNNRYPECIINWIKAAGLINDDNRAEMEDLIHNEVQALNRAILGLSCGDDCTYLRFMNCLIDVREQNLRFFKETRINVETIAYNNMLASLYNRAAVDASNHADKEFGTENIYKTKEAWDVYTDAQDLCLELLDKAYELCTEDDLCLTICKNYIVIAEAVRDSCSYKTHDNYMLNQNFPIAVEDYTFTEEAKAVRTKTIDDWENRKALFDPELRQVRLQETRALYAQIRDAINRELAKVQYWNAHDEERKALNDEWNQACGELFSIDNKILLENAKVKTEPPKINLQIKFAKEELASLGLFKGKEKKALTAKIEELTKSLALLESNCREAIRRLEEEKHRLAARKQEIEDEFKKDRGTTDQMPEPVYMQIFAGSDTRISTNDLIEYHIKTKPIGYKVLPEKSGDMLLKKVLDDGSPYYMIEFAYEQNSPSVRIFTFADDADAHIDPLLSYDIIGATSPASVVDLLNITASTLRGVCPELDLAAFEEKVLEIAYGNASEFTYAFNDIRICIKGGGKQSLSVKLSPGNTDGDSPA